ncbi:MAG: lysine decarboxylase [Candidatus Kaiserbacteria bacterium]|nr:lysine decarboxylase [Candidatus Kaiserbacteria bacterium]
MNVCVFCSASQIAEKYTKPAEELGKMLGEAGHSLVWGGSDKGLMKQIATSVENAGGKLIGVSVEMFSHVARKNVHEMIMTKTLGERKAIMLERADSIVVLVGGIGTLDELTEVLELRKHSIHTKPIVVLNTDGFYDGMKAQLERMSNEGFLMSANVPRPLEELITFADTPAEVISAI